MYVLFTLSIINFFIHLKQEKILTNKKNYNLNSKSLNINIIFFIISIKYPMILIFKFWKKKIMQEKVDFI